MKILLLNYTDGGGGAAIAAARLLTALKSRNVNVTLGVVDRKTNEAGIISIRKKSNENTSVFIRLIKKVIKKTVSYLSFKFKTSNPILHSKNEKTLIDINYINKSDYDLIHLHWINYNMISIEDIAKIKKPLVWTMHDSWVFCGAEHHPDVLEGDNRFIPGYFKNNKPRTTIGPDICRKTWLRKKKAWKNRSFHFISPSAFEKNMLEKSALFNNMPVKCDIIPNIVPQDIFRPIDKNMLRKIYQIPSGKKVIGFGATGDINNKKSIKGGCFLLETLKKIKDIDDFYLVVFGSVNDSFINNLKIPVFNTGIIENQYILAAIYNLCDVFVCPSVIESFSLVCLEALFSGIPVAAFNTGGIPDIVEHKKTGYLASCFDVDDLYRGIIYCIDNYDTLSSHSLIKAQKEFDNESIIKKHIELYKSVLGIE